MKWSLTRFLPIQILLLALALAGCGKEQAPEASNAAPAQAATPLKKTNVRLQWFDTAQFAGLYVAQDANLFKNAGLDVELRSGGPDLNAITLVSSGSDDFGIWSADHILIAQSKGVPIVMLAAIYREDPNVLMVKENSSIKTPKDFVGKTVTTVFGRSTETVLNAMLANQGVDKSKVKITPFPFNIQSFLEGKVDVSAAYVYDHPYQAQIKGQAVRIIKPSDYGVTFYSDCLFARKDFVEKNPELVKKFVQATIAGWKQALANKDAAVQSTLKHGKGLDEASQRYMLDKSEPLILAENPGKIGLISLDTVTKMAGTLKTQKLLPDTFDPVTSFDNRYVE